VAFRNVIFLVSMIADGLPDTPLGLLFWVAKIEHRAAAAADMVPDDFPPLVLFPTAFISSAVISGSIEQLSRVNYK
jgi:hypothetical protein